ncbi:MAG: hypothetical protein U1F66_06900 [bacterium]
MEYLGVTLMVVCSTLNSAGQFLFKSCVPAGPGRLGGGVLSDRRFWGGIGIYVVGTFLGVYAFRFGDLILLYPLANLSLVWNLLLARKFFGERVDAQRVTATVLILVGCAVLVS